MNIISNGVTEPRAVVILAHGAGAGADSDFMRQLSDRFAASKILVYRFNFGYMQKAIDEARRRPPGKIEGLQAEYQTVLNQVSAETCLPVWVGGKSMGGRIASMIANDSACAGVLCFGYPFHPPGKPEKLRISHLETLAKPMLVVQGERDTFGNRNDIASYQLPSNIHIHILPDGDHSLKPRKSSGISYDSHMQAATDSTVNFIIQHSRLATAESSQQC